MSQTVLAVWSWILAQLPTAAVTVATGYALFKFVGEKWLEDRFARQLKNLQMVLDGQLKLAQADFDHTIHRARKLYDRGFDVMQEAWARANRCFDYATQTAS